MSGAPSDGGKRNGSRSQPAHPHHLPSEHEHAPFERDETRGPAVMPRRKGYYGSVVQLKSIEHEPLALLPEGEQDDRPPDLVVGAEAIAGELGIDKKRLSKVLFRYRRSSTPPPVRKVRGLGLAAERKPLRAWWRRVLVPEDAHTRR
jgi:hypothetical protein